MITRRVTRSQTLNKSLSSIATTTIKTKVTTTKVLSTKNMDKIQKAKTTVKQKAAKKEEKVQLNELPVDSQLNGQLDAVIDSSHPILAAIIEKDSNFKALLNYPESACYLLSEAKLDQAKNFTFNSLARSIIYQQLAGKAAFTIYNRVIALFNEDGVFPTPQQIIDTPFDKLRSAGLSNAKTNYLIDLSKRYADGTLSDEILLKLSDEDIYVKLCEVKGIGKWTVDMFLMGTLHRLDVLPVGDLAIKRQVLKYFNLKPKGKNLITPQEMEEVCEVWRPYRSIVSWYLWQWKDSKV